MQEGEKRFGRGIDNEEILEGEEGRRGETKRRGFPASKYIRGVSFCGGHRKGGCLTENIIHMIQDDIDRTEKAIKTKVALEYLARLMEPRYRQAFLDAERAANTPEELADLLDAAKMHIGQRAARELLDF